MLKSPPQLQNQVSYLILINTVKHRTSAIKIENKHSLYIYFTFLFSLLQLSDAVSIIGREDFPRKWPHLLPVE